MQYIDTNFEWLVFYGNRIEARQWTVARHLSCYNPLSCFTSFRGVKHDKIKFHEFFCVCNFFLSPPSLFLSPLSLSPSLSPLSLFLSICGSLSAALSLSLSLLSLSLSFSLPYLSFYLSRTPVSLPFFFPLMVSSYLSLSNPAFLSIFFSRYLSPTIVSLSSFSLPSLSLFLSICGSLSAAFYFSFSPAPVSLFIFFLSLSTTPISRPIFLSPTLNLFLSFLSLSHTCILSHPLLSLCPTPDQLTN